MNLNYLKDFGKTLYHEVNHDKVSNGAAALAYYLTLAIFPAIIFLLSLLPYLPIQGLEPLIMDSIDQALPSEAAATISGVANGILSERKGGLLSLGLLSTIWILTSGLSAVMQQLNITYNVPEARSFVKVRGTAFLLMLIFTLLMLTSFIMIVAGAWLESYLARVLNWGQALIFFFALLRWIIIFGMITLVFSVTYYIGPNQKQKFRFLSPGSLMGTLSIILASLGFRWYVTNFGNYDATYGSLGGMVILMFWLYILGFVILLGAEINILAGQVAARKPALPASDVRSTLQPSRV